MSAAPVRRLIIGATRNWSRNVLLWNLAADPKNNPHTDNGGCGMCQGAITIDGNTVSRNVAYYAIAHASKFVRPGSVRIASNNLETLPNVAFQTPDKKTVLIVVNSRAVPADIPHTLPRQADHDGAGCGRRRHIYVVIRTSPRDRIPRLN